MLPCQVYYTVIVGDFALVYRPILTHFSIAASPGYHLQISGLRQSDDGIYSCTAQNEYGVKTLNYTIEVMNKTKLTIDKIYYVPKGNSTKITPKVGIAVCSTGLPLRVY